MSKLTVRKHPTQVRAREKVEKVFETASELLINEGIEALTIPRIAEDSGVTVGSIYQYFPNKESILYELYQRWLNGAFDTYRNFSQLNHDVTDAAEYFTNLFRSYLADASNRQHRFSVEMLNALRVNRDLQELDTKHEERLFEQFRNDFAKRGLVSRGKLSSRKSLKLEFLLHLALSLMEMISRSPQQTRAAFIEQACDVLSNAIGEMK